VKDLYVDCAHRAWTSASARKFTSCARTASSPGDSRRLPARGQSAKLRSATASPEAKCFLFQFEESDKLTRGSDFT
jgi:hypothetical protein